MGTPTEREVTDRIGGYVLRMRAETPMERGLLAFLPLHLIRKQGPILISPELALFGDYQVIDQVKSGEDKTDRISFRVNARNGGSLGCIRDAYATAGAMVATIMTAIGILSSEGMLEIEDVIEAEVERALKAAQVLSDPVERIKAELAQMKAVLLAAAE